MKPTLRKGFTNPAVSDLKAILRSQGFWNGSNSPVFGVATEAAVRHFQNSHLGPDGEFLTGDGIVGPRTWWALENPSGNAQRNLLKSTPDFNLRYGMLSEKRQQFVGLALKEHHSGVKEIPDGSNRGDGVDKYIAGFGPAPWCALFVSWLYNQTTGQWPQGRRQAHVQTWWRTAKAAGFTFTRDQQLPLPGDLAVWHFAGDRGHISVVVATNGTGSIINTVGGNEGNRVKLGTRHLDREPRFVGYINLMRDTKGVSSVLRGLLPGSSTGSPSLTSGGTR